MRINLKNSQKVINLAQITDAHLGSKVGAKLLGMDTDDSLKHVVNLVAEECNHIDLLLATGDISNDGSVASYKRFRDLTHSLSKHTLWLPGNHDSLKAMKSSLNSGEELSRNTFIGNWQIIMLNSTTKGEVGGKFAEQELDFLYRSLKKTQNNASHHVLICLHHHPISIDCEWLDQQKIANAERFFNIIDQFKHIRGVLWGHIHQRIDILRDNVKLMATPSSCVQFAPKSQNFKLDRLNPGYRWLHLHADGHIDSEVSRVEKVNFNLDFENSTGY